jgi:hypothetical protein
MKTFAAHDGTSIVNIIVADSLEIAKTHIPSDLNVIEVDETVGIGWELHDGYWRPTQTYPSWVWNEDAREWNPPIPEPEPTETTAYYWDESTVSWVPFDRTVG